MILLNTNNQNEFLCNVCKCRHRHFYKKKILFAFPPSLFYKVMTYGWKNIKNLYSYVNEIIKKQNLIISNKIFCDLYQDNEAYNLTTWKRKILIQIICAFMKIKFTSVVRTLTTKKDKILEFINSVKTYFKIRNFFY